MKIEINNPKSQKEELKFPCLMYMKLIESNDIQIVLATEYGENGNYHFKGTKISKSKDDTYPLGDYSTEWITNDFKPFEGSITLSND